MSFMTLKLTSRLLHGPVNIDIAVPEPGFTDDPKEFYSSTEKYKVLWLLHGSENDCDSWFLCTNVYRYAMERGIVLVSATVLNSDYSNYTTFADGFPVWDFFLEELRSAVFRLLPVSDKREDNYIAGYSMGGNGALMFASSCPELFGGVAVLSSTAREVDYLRPFAAMESGQFRKAAGDKERFPGPNGTGMRLKEVNQVAKYGTVGDFLASPENAWDRMKETAGEFPMLYACCGTEDRNVYPRFLRFREYCKSLGISGLFEEYQGYGHEHALWDVAIQKAMDYFGL